MLITCQSDVFGCIGLKYILKIKFTFFKLKKLKITHVACICGSRDISF